MPSDELAQVVTWAAFPSSPNNRYGHGDILNHPVVCNPCLLGDCAQVELDRTSRRTEKIVEQSQGSGQQI
jgi:hypothetical protein